jgi:bifunctional non-homologous end joining protein LigD
VDQQVKGIELYSARLRSVMLEQIERNPARGKGLLQVPLEIRKELLNEAISTVSDPIRLSESIEAAPTDLIDAAKELGFEGIVGKQRESVYASGKRSGAWVKYRINRGQEFVIGRLCARRAD